MKLYEFLALTAPIVVIGGLFFLSSCYANAEKAEGHLQEYATSTYPGYEIVSKNCEVSDSDGNGRVRCTLSVRRDADSEIRPDSVECPSRWWPQPFTTECVGVKSVGFFQ